MTCTNEQAAQYDHAPGADLDYGFDWATNGWLEDGEIVTTSTWSVQPAGITLSRQQIAQDAITSVFAAGGVQGRRYLLTNTITTSAGRKDSRNITLDCMIR